MSSKDRRPYLSATSLTQGLLDYCHDNLECKLEMVVDIETPTGIIYASDRNKYVGSTFYEALLVFPVISRTVGEWLSNDLQFSTLSLELSNVDGRFNSFLPGGADYGGWVGKDVNVKLGLSEVAGSYTTIFKGKITDIGGFKRSIKSITILARDSYDRINVTFPKTVFAESTYPKIETKNLGKIVPLIYGDFTVATEPAPASVPAWCTNGNDPFVHFKEMTVDLSSPASPLVCYAVNHDLDLNDPIQLSTDGTLPSPLIAGTTYYAKTITANTFELSATPGGASINTTTTGSGLHKYKPASGSSRGVVSYRISDNDLKEFDTSSVYLKRNDIYYLVPVADISPIGLGNKEFSIAQNPAGTWVEGGPWEYSSSDVIYVKVKGKDLGTYDDNLVSQAKDILITYGGVVSGDFDSSWDTYRDKSTPAESAISTFKSRIWIAEPQPVMTYVLSMLEQVRLEAFINRSLKIELNSLHFEDWNPTPSYTIENWDVVAGSFQTSIDERNNFNRAQGVYNYLPDVNENAYQTSIYKNSAAITQMGKEISKRIVFPNLYEESVVVLQLKEIIKLASSIPEIFTAQLTWRSILQDIGDFILIDVKIGSSVFEKVPVMIREIGYDPDGLKVVVKLWSMMMVPYPGYTPGYAGTVGGYSATIVQET